MQYEAFSAVSYSQPVCCWREGSGILKRMDPRYIYFYANTVIIIHCQNIVTKKRLKCISLVLHFGTMRLYETATMGALLWVGSHGVMASGSTPTDTVRAAMLGLTKLAPFPPRGIFFV